MTVSALSSAPVLSTPDTHLFEDPTPVVNTGSLHRLSDEQVAITYEIKRTVREIRTGRWKRIALQFPDHMLVDGPRISSQLARELSAAREQNTAPAAQTATEQDLTALLARTTLQKDTKAEEQLFILGDTSYGACCVDEIAAEHVDADVVVHYGRSCLSPPSRLPVIYIFTECPLDIDDVISKFKATYPMRDSKVILMADIPYGHHIPILSRRLREQGYNDALATSIVHDPSSLLPNRAVQGEVLQDPEMLRQFALFHISDPPAALLLTLSSRVASMHIYSVELRATTCTTSSRNLSRRYAQLTALSTTPVLGILINTLSVKNYKHILSHVQQQIADAGKKAYTFVVGKVNAAKVANFSEIGGWVIIGCWESSLIESKDFWKPMITPWELNIALQSDTRRVWTGQWEADFQRVLDESKVKRAQQTTVNRLPHDQTIVADASTELETEVNESEEESAPPEFDLRTGRYVSHSRPMQSVTTLQSASDVEIGQLVSPSTALTKRGDGDLASIGGVASPGAEFLRSNRTWQGLGSDYQADEENHPQVGAMSSKMEEGRSGIARGYQVGRGGTKH